MKRLLVLLLLPLTIASPALADPYPPVAVVQTRDLSLSEPTALEGEAWLQDYRALLGALAAGQGYALHGPLRHLERRLRHLASEPQGRFPPPDDRQSWILAGHSVQLVSVDAPAISDQPWAAEVSARHPTPVGNLLVARENLVWLPVAPLQQAMASASGLLDLSPRDDDRARAILASGLDGMRIQPHYRDRPLLSAYAALEGALQAGSGETPHLRGRLREAAAALDGEAGSKSLASELGDLAQQAELPTSAMANVATRLRSAIESRARAMVGTKKPAGAKAPAH